jgi:hypothetical protein
MDNALHSKNLREFSHIRENLGVYSTQKSLIVDDTCYIFNGMISLILLWQKKHAVNPAHTSQILGGCLCLYYFQNDPQKGIFQRNWPLFFFKW